VAIKAVCFYLLKILFPTNLSPLYPYPNDISLLDLKTISSIIIIVTVFGICIILWKKNKAVPIALSYFLITLIPVLGIVQVGGQSAADRYTYLPSIGPFILIGLGVATMMKNTRTGKDRFNAVTYLVIFITVIFLCFNLTLTFKQIKYWKNSVSLWDRVISIYPDQSWVAYYNRANSFLASKNYGKAIKDYSKVIELNPYYAYSYYGRGKSHLGARDFHKSIRDLSKAILLDKTKPSFYYFRAQAYRSLGDRKRAYRDSATAIRLKSRQNR
jgi:tetratricopeptide (TPR) repeat protein